MSQFDPKQDISLASLQDLYACEGQKPNRLAMGLWALISHNRPKPEPVVEAVVETASKTQFASDRPQRKKASKQAKKIQAPSE